MGTITPHIPHVPPCVPAHARLPAGMEGSAGVQPGCPGCCTAHPGRGCPGASQSQLQKGTSLGAGVKGCLEQWKHGAEPQAAPSPHSRLALQPTGARWLSLFGKGTVGT